MPAWVTFKVICKYIFEYIEFRLKSQRDYELPESYRLFGMNK